MNTIDYIKSLIDQIGSEGYKDGSSTKRGWLYHPIPFAEFYSPIHKTSTTEEFDCIKNDYGNFKGKKVLDIGCANGYFSFNLSLEGADVLAYEADNLVCKVNEEIRKYKQIGNLKFVPKHFDLEEAKSFEDKEFDVIIMLNIHMWIHKQIGASATKELMCLLSKKCHTIYFQTAHKGGGGGYQVPEFTKPKHIKRYLCDSGFTNVEMINQNMQWFKRYMFRGTGA